MEIFSKTEGSTFYFQSPLPYLCTCTITVDAKRKDHVEERKSERQMKIELQRKFLDCTIIAYSILRNGYNVVLQTSWKMEIAYNNGTAFWEIPMKEEYGLSMLLASGFLQGCAAKHESGRWGLHQWLLSCGGVMQTKWYGKSRNGVSFDRLACNRQKETLFLMPYYWDMKRVACHCFMSFGLCNKNGTASCGYKSQPLSARQTKKSPWQYSLELFQGIPPRIFLAVP